MLLIFIKKLINTRALCFKKDNPWHVLNCKFLSKVALKINLKKKKKTNIKKKKK